MVLTNFSLQTVWSSKYKNNNKITNTMECKLEHLSVGHNISWAQNNLPKHLEKNVCPLAVWGYIFFFAIRSRANTIYIYIYGSCLR